ncbi:hypothetical protein BDN70DRAFT_940062, partial [Pholiota conissans]
AVAGVFTVAELIVVALVIALITNGIRLHRARRFDRKLAAATLETASAPQSVFLDDEDDECGPGARGGYGGSGSGDDWTYLATGRTRSLRRASAHTASRMVAPGMVLDPYAVAAAGEAAGAAGIGMARARSEKATRLRCRTGANRMWRSLLREVPLLRRTHPALPGSRRVISIFSKRRVREATSLVWALCRADNHQPYPGSQGQPQIHQRSSSASAEYANLDRSRSMDNRKGQQQQGGYYSW